MNCTSFDALGRSGNEYLIARAIQFFVPGIPQVYYVGLLAGTNDMELLARTQVGRDINRHYYTSSELRSALADPVVRLWFSKMSSGVRSLRISNIQIEVRWREAYKRRLHSGACNAVRRKHRQKIVDDQAAIPSS